MHDCKPIKSGTVLGDVAENNFAIGIDVNVRWSACLSRSCIVLKRRNILTRFLLHTTAPSLSQIVLKFGLHRSTPSQILPQSDLPLLI